MGAKSKSKCARLVTLSVAHGIYLSQSSRRNTRRTLDNLGSMSHNTSKCSHALGLHDDKMAYIRDKNKNERFIRSVVEQFHELPGQWELLEADGMVVCRIIDG